MQNLSNITDNGKLEPHCEFVFTVSLFSTILLRCFPGLNSIMRLIFSILLIATALLISSCEYFGFSSARKLDHPLVMIGVDGGEWDVIETLMEKGELPNLAKLIDTGISGHLINPGPATSPPVWTTFATGQFPREHGILEHVYPYDDSAAKKPVDSSMRLKPALWNLASDYGLKSTVMGYFVSWPAETINGTIVSDRAFQGLESAVSPAEDAAAFEEVFAPLQWGEGRQEALDRYFPWGYRPEQALDEQDPNHLAAKQIINRVDRLLVNDEATRRAVEQASISDVDLFIAYYRSPDIAGHSFWKYWDDTDYEQKPDPDMKEKLGRALPESYRFVDQAVGELMERFGEQANYLVVSDHGFRSAEERIIETPSHTWELTGNHRLNGIFIASGPDIASGRIEMLTTLDIMPTVTALLGIPLSDELPGSIDYRILRPDFESDHPLQTITAYQQSGQSLDQEGASSAGQESTMEELRGLGYIGVDVELVEDSESREYSFWEAASETVITHSSGEIVYYLIKDERESALDVLQQLRANRPELEVEVYILTRSRLRGLERNLPGKPRLLNLLNDFDPDFNEEASG